MKRHNCILSLALCAGALLSGGPALANSRYPLALRVRELSADRLLLAATYGMLLSPDRGKSWYYICERSLFGKVPPFGFALDPLFEALADGALVSGFEGLV